MKVAWANARASWSCLRARVGAFSLRERIATAAVAIALLAVIYLALWAFLNQQGIWMGDLFFRKVGENRYEASAQRFQGIGSTVAVETEPGCGYRVQWNGYDWHGTIINHHLVDDDGNIIASQQLPFWGKVPNSSEDNEILHEDYFIYILDGMSANDLEPLGRISNTMFPLIFIFYLPAILFVYLFPGGVHRIRCAIAGDYPDGLTPEERQRMQFSAFLAFAFIVALGLFDTAQTIISNWI